MKQCRVVTTESEHVYPLAMRAHTTLAVVSFATALVASGCGPDLVSSVGTGATTGGIGSTTSGMVDASTGGPTSGPADTTGSESAAGTTAPTVTDSGTATSGTTSAEPGTTSTTSPTNDDGPWTSGFLLPPDLSGSNDECSTFLQNCPAGEKCTVRRDDGAYQRMVCVPIVDDPAGHGEPCMREGGANSGRDTCDFGMLCWRIDAETEVGTCIDYCLGSSWAPHCDLDQYCAQSSSDLAICLPECNPLAQDCPAGDGCYGDFSRFACWPDASQGNGNFGEPCEFINACAPGLECLGGTAFPACQASGCCTYFCDASAAAPCPEEFDCYPVYESGHAPPGEENYGYCVYEA